MKSNLDFNKLFKLPPYSLGKWEKHKGIFFKYLKNLENFHKNNCSEYKKILKGYNYKTPKNLNELMFIPVNLFKKFKLISGNRKNIESVISSSGTSANALSKIHLNRENSIKQSRVFLKLIYDLIGNNKYPMIIIDKKSDGNKKYFDAREAAIRAFSILSKDTFYLIDDRENLREKELIDFINRYKNEKIIIFGFTFVIWKKFVKTFKKNNLIRFKNAVMFHGGGWKKMQDEKISNEDFKSIIKNSFNINNIINYYGMAEQTGSIYFECEYGKFHTSNFSDVIARNRDLKNCGFNKIGFLQVISSLPESYPGHSLLTEDLGIVIGEDDCKCKRKGKYFKVLGRVQDTDVKGCSDAY